MESEAEPMQKVIDSFTLTTRHRKPENQDAAFTLSAESAPADRANMLISCVMDGVTTAGRPLPSPAAFCAAICWPF